jgi:pyruvate-formate lyase-activating enzyme
VDVKQKGSEPGRPRDRVEAARRVGLAPGLTETLFRLREDCDQSCLFCSADPALEPCLSGSAALSEALRARPAQERRLVVLSGGEPTLEPALAERVESVLAAGAGTVMVQSNAMGLSEPRLLDALRPFRERLLFLVSLHSHRPEVAEVLTRYRGSWERTLAGVDAALATGFTVWLNHVLNTLNFFDAEPFVRFVDERLPEVSLLLFSYVTPTYRAARNAWLLPPLDAVSPPLCQALERARERGLATAVSENCGVPASLGFSPAPSRGRRLVVRIRGLGPRASGGVAGSRRALPDRARPEGGPPAAAAAGWW